jgi:F-type H+-transporting ATPase subunit delta
MKIPKEAHKLSRTLFKSSFSNGQLDNAKALALVTKTLQTKPRQYLNALKNYQRLLRLELERRHAVIESAAPLDLSSRAQILVSLRAKYGGSLTSEFVVKPELIGGLRIKLGSDVWDSTVNGRLNALEQSLTNV